MFVDDIKLGEKKQHLDPVWKKEMKHVNLEEPTSLLDHTWDALNANVNLTKVWLMNTEKCSNRESLHLKII